MYMYNTCIRMNRVFRFNRILFLHSTRHSLPSSVRASAPFIRGICSDKLSDIVIPVPIKVANNLDDINIGEDITGKKLSKTESLKVLNEFFRRSPIKRMAEDAGLDDKLFTSAFTSFRKYCLESEVLPPELHISLSDIIDSSSHVDDLWPFFLKHSRQVYPHLECMDELRKISDLRSPHAWYPEARSIQRKIVFHAGPTNSGKTYNAMKAFLTANTAVYCGPLKLLAVEVNSKSNDSGTPCDLVTGEERSFAVDADHPSSHISCTVEMSSTVNPVDVAVIDEIQMIRDPQRGWAWTRALLGIPAKEVHLCGEEAALDIVREMLLTCGEEVEVHRHKRLTPLIIDDEAVISLTNVKRGDCIVCFNKTDIFNVSLALEKLGHEVAVIYGGLPPSTKIGQQKRFNDPNDSCDVLVATDAIGMGLNLSIKRVIFYSLIKPTLNAKGEKEMEVISVSSALQIGGRAGRFGTGTDAGHVTTFKKEDISILKDLFNSTVGTIESAGIHPTADQIEMFAYHLPDATLSNLIDIFVSLSQVDTNFFFMCNVDDFKFLAQMIQHVPLPLRTRYVFCCAPINRTFPFVCTLFLKFARMYSQNEPITTDWLQRVVNYPFNSPSKLSELIHLEQVFDVLDLYLWLSYRFPDLFPEQSLVREMQKELDHLIHLGVIKITRLLKASSDEPKIGHRASGRVNFSPQSLVDKVEGNVTNVKMPSLTNQLISSGILSEKMVQDLKKEWMGSLTSTSTSPPSTLPFTVKGKVNSSHPFPSYKRGGGGGGKVGKRNK